MNATTRANIAARGVSVWLQADFDVLMRRVRKRTNRPLLQTGNPEAVLKQLIEARYPTYALADLTVDSHDAPHETVLASAIAALDTYLARGAA
jgi:shikimate kinase